MDPNELDQRVEIAEKRILMFQRKIMTEKDHVKALIFKLECEANNLVDMKSEWIRKRNTEDERAKSDVQRLQTLHRHEMEDLRVKYEGERQDKLREIKTKISELEQDIEEWRHKRDAAIMKTKAEENKLRHSYQDKINSVIRAEQASQRLGIVDRSRLVTLPSIFSSNSIRSGNRIGFKRNNPF